MAKYKFLIFVYLISVASSSIANFFWVDVQNLYRVPFLNIRWIDVAILIVIGSYFYSLTRTYDLIKKNSLIISLCFIYLLFESFQLLRSWQATDTTWQISWFLCTLNFFIIIDLSTFKIIEDRIIVFLKYLTLWGSIVLIISNVYLFYSFISGNVIFTDLDIRAAIDILGAKETVSTVVLTPFVYAFSLYFIKNEIKLWKKVVYIAAILSIYVSLVITFHRGNLFTIILLTIIYIAMFSRKPYQAFSKLFGMGLLICIFYFLFGNTLRQKGYDPIEKIVETVQFSMEVNNPNWDKGRSIPRIYAINAWKKHVWAGVGYDDLHNYGLDNTISTAHNFIITSLFHRGIIGTAIYLLILFILFGNSIKFWSLLSREESYQNDMLKLLIVVSFFWLIPFWTQEVIWEKYSLSIEFMYLGIITNMYKQRKSLLTI